MERVVRHTCIDCKYDLHEGDDKYVICYCCDMYYDKWELDPETETTRIENRSW